MDNREREIRIAISIGKELFDSGYADRIAYKVNPCEKYSDMGLDVPSDKGSEYAVNYEMLWQFADKKLWTIGSQIQDIIFDKWTDDELDYQIGKQIAYFIKSVEKQTKAAEVYV